MRYMYTFGNIMETNLPIVQANTLTWINLEVVPEPRPSIGESYGVEQVGQSFSPEMQGGGSESRIV